MVFAVSSYLLIQIGYPVPSIIYIKDFLTADDGFFE